MKKIKIKKSKLLIYLFIFVLLLTLSNARGYSVSPFSPAALFALSWCGFSLPIIAAEYLICNVILLNGIADIYCAIATVFVLIITYLLHKQIKRPMNVALVGVYTFLSQAVSFYYIWSVGGIIDAAIFLVVLICFLYACVNIFQIIVLRGWFYKLTLDESLCLIVFIIGLTFGVAEIYVFDCSLYKFIATFFILLCIGINKKEFAIIAGVAMGIAVAITNSNLEAIGELAIIAVGANIFSYPHKYRIGLLTIIASVATQIYFIGVEWGVLYNIIPVVLAATLFVCMPNKLLEKLADKYLACNNELSTRNIINSTRKSIRHKMQELSCVFDQMKNMHLKLIKSGMSKKQAVSVLAEDICKTICAECKNKNYCHKGIGVGDPSINKLIEVGLKKGKVTILDLPSNVAQKCGVVNLLIGKINQLLGQYFQGNENIEETNNIKYLLAEQMGAVSQMLADLGQEIDENIVFDNTLHDKILNQLLSSNIICSEVLIFAEKNKEVSVVAIVKGENAYNPVIEKIISKALNLSMVVTEIEPTDLNDYYSVKLVRSCERDIAFGIASITKSGSSSSGDSHSLIRLGNNRYLLALCDGMGSGENARKMSALTMGLVENFYRAGFDTEFILNTINKLLAVNNQENFSTLDLCVVDLSREIIDFIKLGASFSAIKREHFVDRVDSGTLPLGILGEVNPSVSHFAITGKDMIVMITDGVSDSFGDFEQFAEFINAVVTTNPQVAAQTILDEAISRNGGVAKDDMTIMVARSFIKGDGVVNKNKL